MIRHRPAGSGHPYVPDTEQRWPVQPVAGEPLRLGVRTSGEIDRVILELSVDGGELQPYPLTAVPRSSRGQAVDGGHLASAQARQARQAGGWQLDLPAAPDGRLRYRFAAVRPDGATEHTRWFEVRAA
ncbi:MAG: glycoside hydrolase family 31, partial [Propionicimonas sp.]